MEESLLGKESPYLDNYSPELLVAIKRAPIRKELGINSSRMYGVDIWNHWEVSWLDKSGKPQVACYSITYDANSENIVESKSLKLYFNSLNQTKFDSEQELVAIIQSDLDSIIGQPVIIKRLGEECLDVNWTKAYQSIDDLAVSIEHYLPAPELLAIDDEANIVTQKLSSDLFKTNCMVTGQPDWASVYIHYTGPSIDHQSLLAYLISFRNHQAFHEPSCEMLFSDILARCKPEKLSIYCRYTRRGGIDINPYRSTEQASVANQRIMRQ
jgi:7-cyano-7-deazaguanine reductase